MVPSSRGGAASSNSAGWAAYFPISRGEGSDSSSEGQLGVRPARTGVVGLLLRDEARAPSRRALAVRAALLGVLLAAAAAATALSRTSQHLGKVSLPAQLEIKATWESDFPSQCGWMDVDVEYQDEESGWGTNYDHIPTPEMCCAMCQDEPRCMAFTWVKDAGLDGCPSQCWLKGGRGSKNVSKTGMVSGFPPLRRQMQKLPQTQDSTISLYCFSLVVPDSYEMELLRWQFDNKQSIFGCDKAAVYSNKAITAAPGVTAIVVDSDLKCEYGGDSGTALNAWIFIAVWDALLDDGGYKKYDWTVKVDADCVFFPNRLVGVLKDHQGEAYVNNCKYGMHGPIEVFSKSAMEKLSADYEASWDGKSPKRCVTEQHFGEWGEDMFIDQCLSKILAVGESPVDERLMCESHCDCPAWYWCQNGTDRVSFHPFKTVDAYQNCVANALGGPRLAEGEVQKGAPSSGGGGYDKATEDPQPAEKEEEDAAPAPADEASQPADGDDGGSPEEETQAEEAPEEAGAAAPAAADPSGGPAEQSCAEYGCVDSFDESRSCQCNPGCSDYGSCCPDYDSACKKSAGSCATFGCSSTFSSENSCQCNPECATYGSCCDDYAAQCEEGRQQPQEAAAVQPEPALEPAASPAGSEEGAAVGDGNDASEECRDAVEGDECWQSIEKARNSNGAYEHSEWFDGLTAESQSREYQAVLHKNGQGECSMPCGSVEGHVHKSAAGGGTAAEGSSEQAADASAPGPRAQTFYTYRAQSKATYPLENINTADLAGVLWYLHNEVITATPRKYKIDRIKRYRITVKNTWEFWNAHKRQFSAFVAFDAGRCSTPICKDIYHQYGFIVGCQKQDLKVASYLAPKQTSWDCDAGSDECNAPIWYSLPGPCPSMGMSNGEINPNKVGLDVNKAKTKDCIKRMPGGHCKKATGAPDCTYSYEEAGEIFLDELAGIPDYEDFWNGSFVDCMDKVAEHKLPKNTTCRHNKEYDTKTDKGVGTDFWNGKHDKEKCAKRMEAARSLFKMHYPDFPADLPAPPCEFDMYYDGEFKWAVNHTGAAPSDWWEHRLQA